MTPFPKKVILITGTSSGFGLLTAARLAAKGHTVFATMRDLDKKEDLLKEVARRGGKVELLPLDITDYHSIRNAVIEVKNRAGRIDVLVNNAGYAIGGFFEDLSEDDIRAQLETNFFGTQNLIRSVLPTLREQRSGKIINLSSIAGLYALPAFGAYNASKWALEGFSESLYYELKPFGIDVCLIEPGGYRTKIFYENRRYASKFDNPESPYYRYSQQIKDKINARVDKDTKDPEDIPRLIEKLITSNNPPFRSIPDFRSKLLYTLRRVLPFKVFSGVVKRAVFQTIKEG